MSDETIELLAGRGEKLTRLLVDFYCLNSERIRCDERFRASKLHNRLHTHGTCDEEQVVLNEKPPGGDLQAL
jgi:hypothetical protein